MIDQHTLAQWLAERQRTRLLLCDIDETLCTQFDQPIHNACATMRRVPQEIIVYYVTARPLETQALTQRFLREQQLPHWHNLFLCPPHQSTLAHKTTRFQEAAVSYEVLWSIGDSEEDAAASAAADVPFFLISRTTPEESWTQLRLLLEKYLHPLDL